MSFLRLKPSFPSLVGEISKRTADAPVDPERRVDFHIGNPVQDDSLDRLYNAVLSGAEFLQPFAEDFNESDFLSDLDDPDLSEYFKLLFETSRKSVAYSPAGGFSPGNPGTLTRKLEAFFNRVQDSPTRYHFGEKGAPEFALASGGRWQALKLLLQVLFEQTEYTSTQGLVLGRLPYPQILAACSNQVTLVENSGPSFFRKLEAARKNSKSDALLFVLLLQKVPQEDRKRLGDFLQQHPVLLIEANDSLQAESLASFSKLKGQMIRILSPAVIHPYLNWSSLSFILAPADVIAAFNRQHFKKMGTPSASEIKLLNFFLAEDGTLLPDRIPGGKTPDFSRSETAQTKGLVSDVPFPAGLSTFLKRIPKIAEAISQNIQHEAARLTARSEQMAARLSESIPGRGEKQGYPPAQDPFLGRRQEDMVRDFFRNLGNPSYQEDLQKSFLSVFQYLHPEYQPDHLIPVSGSARTALSAMAEFWDIREVIVPDFSWTVNDAFPRVTAVPLGENLQLDARRFTSVLQEKMAADSNWRNTGAVILNNPHNATGKIWNERDVEAVLLFCLQNGIRVIDDLSYSNVVIASADARAERVPVKTLKMLAIGAVSQGKLRQSQVRFLVTLQSISKTDCKAGARLAVCDVPDPVLRKKLSAALAPIPPNLMAVFMSTLFYRQGEDKVARFARLRDWIMSERTKALQREFESLSSEANPYHMIYVSPEGAMYPRLFVTDMPGTVQIEKIAFQLAGQGIGLIPMTNFSQTVEGFDLARRTFRLTLGGRLEMDTIPQKVRRLVTELSEQIRRQAENYHYYSLTESDLFRQVKADAVTQQRLRAVREKSDAVFEEIRNLAASEFLNACPEWARKNMADSTALQDFLTQFLPSRWRFFQNRLSDWLLIREAVRLNAESPVFRTTVQENFLKELQMESSGTRRRRFSRRLFDRTVHPTQMYSLQVEQWLTRLAKASVAPEVYTPVSAKMLFRALVQEYVGENVPISSQMEAQEAICDLEALHLAEIFNEIFFGHSPGVVLSLWGDWDGSTRPSGQGHTLVSGPLIANIRALTLLVHGLQKENRLTEEDLKQLEKIGSIEKRIENFQNILQKITGLTSRLEEKYRKTIPLEYSPGKIRQFLRKLGLLRDPLKSIWKHNDRNERRMQQYRKQRSSEIKQLFEINRILTGMVEAAVSRNRETLQTADTLFYLQSYKNYLKRFYLTPRIHQKIILDKDQFTIDTTVYNLVELNVLANQYGYDGFVLVIQVSMASSARAILTLYQKLCEEKARVLRKIPGLHLPDIRVVPLFEELEAIRHIPEFLDEIWAFSETTRKLGQPTADRFREIIGEFFIAGSDLSQQVGQLKAYSLYQDAREMLDRWMWEKNLLGRIRIKFGSGESPQRQGGYYDATGGRPVFVEEFYEKNPIVESMEPLKRVSLRHARSPLSGILSHSDFRTFQSNVMEQLRGLRAQELANVFNHIRIKQQDFWTRVLSRASRLPVEGDKTWTILRHLIRREDDAVFLEFLDDVQTNFKQIVYGRPEDMTGIHVVSYFLSRTLLPLRDRPTVRPSKEPAVDRSREIVERLSSTLPLATHGTLLRAIGHNKAQTILLGVNQFTTGLFRATYQFLERGNRNRLELFQQHILPHLPVRDILNTLRLYHDPELTCVRQVEDVFPPGNSALKALKEDQSVLKDFVPLFQEELLRKNGVLAKGQLPSRKEWDDLIPFLRPDLAVLLQEDIFNTQPEVLPGWAHVPESLRPKWEEEFIRRRIIADTREKMWHMLREPISEQVRSFIELARAVKSLFSRESRFEPPTGSVSRGRVTRLASQINDMLRNVVDDSMRQFLLTAVQYFIYLPETMKDIPEEVLLALRDMEKILKLDEEALTREQQKILLSYFLKMARISGNSG
ncbi:MAG: aminotransferase class I/II-fold pyridoxal phosphate-dependent enzyme [Calditrichaeota bacterium]|nr:aminotransferase class I/II-fold pyridoxal phosphate-dependent enzyme [Calditrichota bacterium]